MMKLTIPANCKLGALTFSIKRNDELLDKLDECAHISNRHQSIWIAHRKADQEFVALLHEAFHDIVCRRIGPADAENECLVDSLAHEMAIFLHSLGIEPDFSEIPEDKNEKQ